MKKETTSKTQSKGIKALILIGVIAGGLVVGGGIGFLTGHFLKPKEVDYSKVDINAVEDDVANLLERYETCKSEGQNPTNVFSISELTNISILKYQSSEKSVAYGYGVADSAVKLDIRNIAMRNGNEYMEESLSKSTGAMNIVVAQRDYQHGNQQDSPIDSYVGDIKSDVENPDYSSAKKSDYTVASYEEKFGKAVSRQSVYIISSKTVLEDSSISKVEGGYEIYMNLDTVKSVARYRKRMMNISNSEVASFDYIHLTYTVDDDFNIIKTHVEEKYNAGMGGIKAPVEGKLTTYFFRDVDVTLPESSVNSPIPKEGELYA